MYINNKRGGNIKLKCAVLIIFITEFERYVVYTNLERWLVKRLPTSFSIVLTNDSIHFEDHTFVKQISKGS